MISYNVSLFTSNRHPCARAQGSLPRLLLPPPSLSISSEPSREFVRVSASLKNHILLCVLFFIDFFLHKLQLLPNNTINRYFLPPLSSLPPSSPLPVGKRAISPIEGIIDRYRLLPPLLLPFQSFGKSPLPPRLVSTSVLVRGERKKYRAMSSRIYIFHQYIFALFLRPSLPFPPPPPALLSMYV